MLASFGLELPSTGTVIEPRTIIVGLLVGMIATLLSGFVPARRATHVEPLEAMRDAATPGTKRVSRRRLTTSAVVILLGLAALLLGLFGGLSGGGAAGMTGLGMVVMILGVALLAPVLVRPLARLIGRPLERFQGVSGRLARENAERQPQRTAITASALMIGLALVVFTVDLRLGPERVDRQGDRRAAQPQLADRHARRRVLARARGGRRGAPRGRRASTRSRRCASTRPTSRAAATPCRPPASSRRRSRSCSSPSSPRATCRRWRRCATTRCSPDTNYAKDHGFKVGDTIDVTTPTGKTFAYELAGLYDNQAGTLGQFVVTNASMSEDWNQPDDAFILVGGQGQPEDAREGGRQALEPFPVAKAQTLAQFKDSQADQVNQLLGLVYALLSLSVIVALLGIVNTLALAVHERTRELGLLRAVGMSRRQVRRMVRSESVITALIGAALGHRARDRVRADRVAPAGGRGIRALVPGRDADRARDPGRARGRAGGDPAGPPGLQGRRSQGRDNRVTADVTNIRPCTGRQESRPQSSASVRSRCLSTLRVSQHNELPEGAFTWPPEP